MIPALVTILGFQLVGEVVSRGLHLPLPGPVVGLVLLLAAMRLRPGLAGWLRPVGQGMLAHLSLFFVPAGVGIILHLERLQREWPAILGSVLFATLISVALTGLLLRALSRNKEAGHE